MTTLADLYADPDAVLMRAEADRREVAALAIDADMRHLHCAGSLAEKNVSLIETIVRRKTIEAARLHEIADWNDAEKRRYHLWIMAGGSIADPKLWPPLYRKIGAAEIDAPWEEPGTAARIRARAADSDMKWEAIKRGSAKPQTDEGERTE